MCKLCLDICLTQFYWPHKVVIPECFNPSVKCFRIVANVKTRQVNVYELKHRSNREISRTTQLNARPFLNLISKYSRELFPSRNMFRPHDTTVCTGQKTTVFRQLFCNITSQDETACAWCLVHTSHEFGEKFLEMTLYQISSKQSVLMGWVGTNTVCDCTKK